ncbi:MAG: chorismate-binding protein, partial [Flavobacteriales bacterium]
MSIDDIIANERFFATCVLPEEFDSTRTPIFFEYNRGTFQSASGATFIAAPFASYHQNIPQLETPQSEHSKAVEAALQSIESGELEKVVISCIKHAKRTSLALQSIFDRLCGRYQNACVYALHHPAFGTWVGATPELLLYKQGMNYHTVSLAGTQPFSETLQWSEKLQREQQLV